LSQLNHMKKLLFSIFVFVSIIKTNAQCPTVAVTPTIQNITCAGGSGNFTLTSNLGPNLTIDWYGPGGAPLVSTEWGTGPVYSTFTVAAAGVYSVNVKVTTGTCVTTKTVQVTASVGIPYFELSAPTYTACSGSTVSVKAVSVVTSPMPNVPVKYYMGVNQATSSAVFSVNPTFNINSCGNYYYSVMDLTNNCFSSMKIKIGCNTLTPIPLNVSASSNSICIGSSVTFSASGANTYTWSNNSNASTFSLFPTVNASYSVMATDANSCVSTGVAAVTVNTNCATVWPGDANSDGVVNSLDIFELGLQFTATGPARTTTSNVYSAQDAALWTGTVSTGKNKAHADCDGDGSVGISDTLAINNNFLLTHALKPAATSSTEQVTIVPDQANALVNVWNTAGIFLGDVSNPINNIYGVSFDVEFDTSLISANNIYISYPNSFINASNTNITLSKQIYNNERVYGATVRTNANNVSGSGRIATLYFKPKANAANNSTLNLVVLNGTRIDKDANLVALTTGSVSTTILNDVGISANVLSNNSIFIYPNPASEFVIINAPDENDLNIRIMDISGRIIHESRFSGHKKINLQNTQNGVYTVQVTGQKHTFCQKLIVNH